MYLVMKIIKEMEGNADLLPFPINIKMMSDDGIIGVLPVFELKKDAEEYANGAEILKIQLAEEK